MVPLLHSVLRVPDLHAVAGVRPTPPRAAARRFIKRTSLSLNNPHARTRHRCALESSRTMQAPVALAGRTGHHTCAFSRSAYARCGLQARRMPCLCFAATDPQVDTGQPQLHCGQQAGNDLHAAAFPCYRQWPTGPLHSRAAVLPSFVLEVMLTRNKRSNKTPNGYNHLVCTRRRTTQDPPPIALVFVEMHSTPARSGTQPIPFLPAL
jgi:hypothetical protein